MNEYMALRVGDTWADMAGKRFVVSKVRFYADHRVIAELATAGNLTYEMVPAFLFANYQIVATHEQNSILWDALAVPA